MYCMSSVQEAHIRKALNHVVHGSYFYAAARDTELADAELSFRASPGLRPCKPPITVFSSADPYIHNLLLCVFVFKDILLNIYILLIH